ncbi:TIGR00341 family protein [Candidatus Campbellbacteria bacterium RIFOXYC2_FULL_35_25]|uniref:TIGR00341 family protein n=1 Tax=Candidatus Campbellbacteria bacterium RIFOXYC2_FULL_35_25 TaxID=1797582 RepID=A0A1F5EI51_9BACT|nr:MAG: TIGR00341 family protein [Candidatus Campbellbacteria bacterium RIFOXYC2_FULL_35_25]
MTEKDKGNAVEHLICESTPRQDFFLLVILSVLMATFGLLINSVSIIIGSMLIAPILYPILGLSLGVVIADGKLITRSFYTLLKSVAFGIAGSAIITIFFSSNFQMNPEILARTQPSLIYGTVAMIAGLAASFALIKPQLSATLPGTAISVALIPPLAVTGIGVARFDWGMITNSFILFLINAIGIIFASMVVFSLMHLYVKRDVASKTIKKENLAIEKEQKDAEKEAKKDN